MSAESAAAGKRLFDGGPFVLCEDARSQDGLARLFRGPCETIVAHRLSDVAPALEALRGRMKRGMYAAGWLNYEAGLAFEPRLMARVGEHADRRGPLAWFGLFDGFRSLSREELADALPDPAGAWVSPPRPRVSRADYGAAFARVRQYIVAGDIYQVNLSYRADLTLLGHPLAAYAQLRDAGRGAWSGVAFDGSNWLISTSPELFFKLRAGEIEAKPMKGTARRHEDPARDRLAAQELRSNEKELAENVMIVDLLRNDISKLARRGSVHVPELFALETYPTLHTLTSTVRGRLRDEYDAVDALRALFPCGSVTGAPKIRAMEIIGELETDSRGPYTGAIGWMSPSGDAEFNVAIRTIAVCGGRAEIGLGSAVVYDSDAESEWRECQVKGAFVSARAPRFDLIETMRFDPPKTVRHLSLHLQRLFKSAGVFGFALDESAVRARIEEAVAGRCESCVVRLRLSPDGAVAVQLKDLPAFADSPVQAALAPLPAASEDFRLRHKTTLRGFYDAPRKEADAEEVVFVDESGFVTEGSFSNVFVRRDGVLWTPPANRGLLPGVLRTSLLAAGQAQERDLCPADLAGGFYLGNAVRGLVEAQLRRESEGVLTEGAPTFARGGRGPGGRPITGN